MKITRIGGHDGYAKKLAISCIASGLEYQGRSVLNVAGNSTTAGNLQMCRSPVPFAIVIHDFDQAGRIDLEALCAEPRLQSVLCFVEQAPAMPNDELDDVLPLAVPRKFSHDAAAHSNGIVTLAGLAPLDLVIAADSEGGEHD